MLLILVGILGWLAPTVAGIWFLVTVRDIRDELKLIRRYLQAIHDQREQGNRY